LLNAGCAVNGATSSGFFMEGRFSAAQSRAALTAIRMLSVPPEVIEPAVLLSPFNNEATMEMNSVSIFSRLGKSKGLSAFSNMQESYASRDISSTSCPA